MESAEMTWRRTILSDLQQKNLYITDTFSSLIESHNKLLDSSESYRLTNNRLSVEVERLQAEISDQRNGGGGGGEGRSASLFGTSRLVSESTQALEQKLFRLQEELTEVHRKRSENAQQVIDLNNSLSEKEKLLSAKDTKIKELEDRIKFLEEKYQKAEQSAAEAATANQCLLDESQALQMAYSSLELSLRHLQEDNSELIARWMQLKSRDANSMNAENETFIKRKQEQIQSDLVKAAAEHVDVTLPSRSSMSEAPIIPFIVTVPSHALQTFEAHDGEVVAVKWAPSGRTFATGGSDRKLKLWEVSAGKCECKNLLVGSNAGITSIDFDTEESMVLAASNDFASRVWMCSNQRLLHTLTGHSAKVLSAKFIGDGTRVVSGSHDRTLKLWDLRNKACIKTMFAGSCCNDVVALDCNNVISAHFDKKIRFYDMRADSNSQKELMLDGKVTSLDITADKTLLLGCTRDDNIAIVDLRSAEKIKTLSADGFRVATDWTRAAFSPDGAFVIAGSADGGVYVWDMPGGTLNRVLQEHREAVLACAWSPSGQSIVSCDKHKTVVYWSSF